MIREYSPRTSRASHWRNISLMALLRINKWTLWRYTTLPSPASLKCYIRRLPHTIHNIIRRMSILHPRTQEVLPKWHLSMVLKGLMKPPFAINGSDKDISLELLSYKTAFLVVLAKGARGFELVALSRIAHNLDFTTLESGAKQDSIRMFPKFIPKNQRPDLIPKPLEFPGIAHLFPCELERLLCPVRALGLYLVRSQERVQEDIYERLFVHFSPDTQLFTTHFRRWVAETIRLTYETRQNPIFLRSMHMMCGGGGLHSLLQEHSLIWAMWPYWNGSPLTFSSATTQGAWRLTPNFRTSLLWPPGQPCPKGCLLGYSSLTTSTNVS